MSGWGICPSSYQLSFSSWGTRSPGVYGDSDRQEGRGAACLSEQEYELKVGWVGMSGRVLFFRDNEH